MKIVFVFFILCCAIVHTWGYSLCIGTDADSTMEQSDTGVSMPLVFSPTRIYATLGIPADASGQILDNFQSVTLEDNHNRVSLIHLRFSTPFSERYALIEGETSGILVGKNIVRSFGCMKVEGGLGIGSIAYTDTSMRVFRNHSEPVVYILAGADLRAWFVGFSVNGLFLHTRELTLTSMFVSLSLGFLKGNNQ